MDPLLQIPHFTYALVRRKERSESWLDTHRVRSFVLFRVVVLALRMRRPKMSIDVNSQLWGREFYHVDNGKFS